MGTYQLRPYSVGTPNQWSLCQGTTLGVFQPGASDSSVISDPYYNCGGAPGPSPPFDITTRLNFDLSNSIYLDGASTPTAFNNLQAGFVVTSATLYSPHVIRSSNPGLERIKLQFDANTESALLDPTSFETIQSFVYPKSPLPSMLSMLGNGMALRGTTTSTVSSALQAGTVPTVGSYISGNYTIQSFSWTLPITASVKAGDKFTVNGPSNGSGSLSHVVAAHIQYTDSSNKVHDNVVLAQDFIFQSDVQIIFFFPQFGNIATGTTVYLYLEGDNSLSAPSATGVPNSAIFTGQVLAGSLTVTFADASGVYILTPLKANDTIYSSTRDGTTTDIAIQDPTVEFGFMP